MQRQTGLQHRPAVRHPAVALGQRAQRLLRGVQRRPARRPAVLASFVPEYREHAVAHDLREPRRHWRGPAENAVEILVEQPDYGARRENVRQHREIAQIDQHDRGGDRAHVAAADLPFQD